MTTGPGRGLHEIAFNIVMFDIDSSTRIFYPSPAMTRLLDRLPPPAELTRRLRRIARNVALSTACAALLAIGRDLAPPLDPAPPAMPTPPAAELPVAEPDSAAHRTLHGVIRAGKGLAESLATAGVAPNLIPDIVRRLAPSLDLRRLRPGERFTAVLAESGDLVSLSYEKTPLEALVLKATPDGWETEIAPLPVETRVVEVRGTIRSSLFEAVDRAGEGDALAVAFAELLAWDVDFAHEMQTGDTFRAVVEKAYRDGRFLQYGRILAAEYRGGDHAHRAYFYPWPDGSGDWYAADGRSVRASFLRAPISYSRISSGFSRARLHPILNRVQPHLGVDFAAPHGTPVWAPADGVVAALKSDSAGGRQVVLRHAGGYETHYLHLSRYARGLRRGVRVEQKEIIGYVGSTGLATGPHLDYRVRRHGAWVNPLTEDFPRGEPLPAEHAERFAEQRAWLDGFSTSPGPALASR